MIVVDADPQCTETLCGRQYIIRCVNSLQICAKYQDLVLSVICKHEPIRMVTGDFHRHPTRGTLLVLVKLPIAINLLDGLAENICQITDNYLTFFRRTEASLAADARWSNIVQ